jgi:hypothetical protein
VITNTTGIPFWYSSKEIIVYKGYYAKQVTVRIFWYLMDNNEKDEWDNFKEDTCKLLVPNDASNNIALRYPWMAIICSSHPVWMPNMDV